MPHKNWTHVNIRVAPVNYNEKLKKLAKADGVKSPHKLELMIDAEEERKAEEQTLRDASEKAVEQEFGN